MTSTRGMDSLKTTRATGGVIDMRAGAQRPPRPATPPPRAPIKRRKPILGGAKRSVPVRPREDRRSAAPGHQPSRARRSASRLLGGLEYAAIVIGSLAAAYSYTAGQWLVVAYAVYVLVRRASSRGPFVGALLLLVCIPVFQIIHLEAFSQNAAIYAYELLVIGVVRALFEVRHAPAQT